MSESIQLPSAVGLTDQDKFLQEYLKTMSGYTDKTIHGTAEEISGLSETYFYKSILDFVSQEGKIYTPVDLTIDQQRYIRKRIRALGFSPKQSSQAFHNSYKLSYYDKRKVIKYVEGYVLNDNLSSQTGHRVPRLHAWNEIEGKVIDITITDRELNARDGYTLGQYRNTSYIGIVFSSDEIQSHILGSGFASSIIDNPARKWPLLKHKFDHSR